MDWETIVDQAEPSDATFVTELHLRVQACSNAAQRTRAPRPADGRCAR